MIVGKYGQVEGGLCSKVVREGHGVGVWKAIKGRWEMFKTRTRFTVGLGNKVKFWKDKWCGDSSLRESFPKLYSIAFSKDAWVSDLWEDCGWSLRFTRQLHDWELEEVQAFLGRLLVHPLFVETDDVMVWLPTKDGAFSVKSFYSSLVNRRVEPFPYGIVWNSWVPSRISFFCLGSNLDQDFDFGSTQKERLEDS